MKKLLLFTFFCSAVSVLYAQKYPSSIIFAHNDYVQTMPLTEAYQYRVGYIEADIFLMDNELFVAHTEEEIEQSQTLEKMYLDPLSQLIAKNDGLAYADSQQELTLMIDLKNEGEASLRKLVEQLEHYPSLINCPTFKVGVSGAMPERKQWSEFPSYIHFDGRPHIKYTPDQLQRVLMVSTDFGKLTAWNGKGVLTAQDANQVTEVINQAHEWNKKIRFWGAPDFTNAWIELRKMGADIINTDHVKELSAFINTSDKNTFKADKVYQVYEPKHKFKKKPKNIILLIGDGTGLAQWYAGYTGNGGALNVFQMKSLGYAVTTSVDSYITDSAAGATAMASGQKTNNRFIGVDEHGEVLPLITNKLDEHGIHTAIISNGNITDATPAAFYAHNSERGNAEAIAKDLTKANIDIVIGGGVDTFSEREDGDNLIAAMENNGYQFSSTFNDKVQPSSAKHLILDKAVTRSMKKGRGSFLEKALRYSVKTFREKKQHFFIMEEAAQIDWGGHSNDLNYVVEEVLDFDKAIGAAMKMVDEDQETLLIVTADHETGGLSLIGGSIANKEVISNFSTNDHTGIMVPVFAYGPGAEVFQGVYQNTDIYHKILAVLNVKE